MAPIPFPISTSPGLRPPEGTGRLINVFAEPRGEDLGPVWRRAPGVSIFANVGEGTFRGGVEVNGTLYAAFGTKFYSVLYTGSPLGSAISGGTPFGDMTGDGNLAAAFDGTTNQAVTACATKASATVAYIGKSLDEPLPIFHAIVHGSNDAGYVGSANPDVTLELYAKKGAAPIDEEDGTLLGTLTFTDTADESGNARTVSSDNITTKWDHVWVRITHDGSSATMSCAEVSFRETVKAIVTEMDTLAGNDRIDIFRNNAATPDIAIVCNDGPKVVDLSDGDLDDYPDGDIGTPTCGCVHLGWFMFGYGNGDIQASGLNTTDINTLDRARTESNPDGVLRLLSLNGMLYAFGNVSIEIWGNPVNDEGFPLNRLGYNVTPGLASADAIAGWEPEYGNAPIYVASDDTVRWLRGDSPEKISPPDLDRLLATVADKNQLDAFCYIEGGHAFWQLNGPNFSWVFNLNNLQWHERSSYLLPKSRLTRSVSAFRKWLVGDTESGALLEIDHTVHDEAGTPLVAEIESGAVEDFPNRVRVARAEFELTPGVGIATGVDPVQTDPTVEVSWSDDGGRTWSTPWLRKLGRQGKSEQRIIVLNTGLSGPLGRRWKLRVSDAVHFGLMGGEMRAELRRN